MILKKEDLYLETHLKRLERRSQKKKKKLYLIDDNFRVKLVNKRISKNFTQRGLADKIKATQCFISKVENGKTIPTVRSLIRITEALGCTLFLDIKE